MIAATVDSASASHVQAPPAAHPLVFGVIGVGGYGGVICQALAAGSRQAEPVVRLAAVAEPDHERNAARIAELRGGGARAYGSAEELLADREVEAVWLPLPIDLHRSYTEKALAAGKAVMCEKPAAGCVDDVDAMIAARDRDRLPVAIGFQHVYDPQMQSAKRRILAGEIGRVSAVSLHGCWPRSEVYYGRSNWAGAFKRNGVWVMDSPANNAMAHYINIALFLLGPTEGESVTPVTVEAELYRANPIENFDTCSLRYELPAGTGGAAANFVVLMTHACRESIDPTLVITGERGTVRYVNMKYLEFNGVREAAVGGAAMQENMQRAFARYVRSGGQGVVATLESARAHTVAVNGASEAAPITSIDPRHVIVTPVDDHPGQVLRSLPGIESAFATCAAKGLMLSESGLVPWAVSPGRKDLRGYRHFGGPRT